MTSKSTNQTIHEAMSLCWHEWDGDEQCDKCGKYDFPPHSFNPDYTSDWSAYGKAIEWAMGEEWWAEFAYEVRQVSPAHILMASFLRDDLLIMSEGSTALAEFITEHPEYFKKEVV